MVITLTDTGDKKGSGDNTKLYFPLNPNNISYRRASYFQEYNILNKGAAKVPNGEEITTIGWSCFFPGEKMNIPCKIEDVQPKKIHQRLEEWQKAGKKLKLNISGTPFSFWVYIDTYEAEIADAFGSIYYTIEFSKVVNISVEKVPKEKSIGKTTGNDRVSKNDSAKKYTVKKGDCLWNIAKTFYKDGTQWKKIYNANKTVIENTAKKHGKKSSSNGHWIYPGTVLSIP